MRSRVVLLGTMIAVAIWLAPSVVAQAKDTAKSLAAAPAAPAKPSAKPNGAPLTPARERQARCAQEWRSLSTSDKASEGPAWPQFYSRCVKRLKAQKS